MPGNKHLLRVVELTYTLRGRGAMRRCRRMHLQTIWTAHAPCGPPKQSLFAPASRQAARTVTRNFAISALRRFAIARQHLRHEATGISWLGRADRFGNQANPEYGLARGVE